MQTEPSVGPAGDPTASPPTAGAPDPGRPAIDPAIDGPAAAGVEARRDANRVDNRGPREPRPRRATARFMLSHPLHLFSLGFGSGLSPVVPGTIGTLFA